mgnify:FL=1
MEKLTEYELLKRLDNEFADVDFSVRDCATKGVVATVYFYEDKFVEVKAKTAEEAEELVLKGSA